MNSVNSQLAINQEVKVAGAARWEVYHRLQALQIPCRCEAHQPLQVQVDNSLAAIQLWSVVRQVTTPRYELVHWLENCWQIDSDSKDR